MNMTSLAHIACGIEPTLASRIRENVEAQLTAKVKWAIGVERFHAKSKTDRQMAVKWSVAAEKQHARLVKLQREFELMMKEVDCGA